MVGFTGNDMTDVAAAPKRVEQAACMARLRASEQLSVKMTWSGALAAEQAAHFGRRQSCDQVAGLEGLGVRPAAGAGAKRRSA